MSATLVDRAWQLFFRTGYRVARIWWRVRRPSTKGAFVGVWFQGRVLVIQNSYVRFRSFPGGGVEPGELPIEAAIRECREEVGLEVGADALSLELEVRHELEGKHDHVWVFELELDALPELRIDHREVVDARFVSPEEALSVPLFEPARRYVEGRRAA